MLQEANSASRPSLGLVEKKKSKNARASLANITMLFPPGTAWRRGWSYTRPTHINEHIVVKLKRF